MESLTKAIENGFMAFSYHKNAPMCEIANILDHTEKALKVRLEHNTREVWLPKSALEAIDQGMAFTVKPWFKRMMNKPENKYTCKALGVLI